MEEVLNDKIRLLQANIEAKKKAIEERNAQKQVIADQLKAKQQEHAEKVKKLEELEERKKILLNSANLKDARTENYAEDYQIRIEEETVSRVKEKLQIDWSDEVFQQCVFRELEIAGFKRLSFLSDIMKKWNLSHLTGYPAILAQAVLPLDRKTDELQFYKDLFKQLDRAKLVGFLAWAVAGGELDESVIGEIVPAFTDKKGT